MQKLKGRKSILRSTSSTSSLVNAGVEGKEVGHCQSYEHKAI